LLRILNSFDADRTPGSEDGFTLYVKCSIQEQRLKFISNPLKLSWDQFDLSCEIDDLRKDYMVPLEFAEETRD